MSQLHFFSFPTELKVYHPTPKDLNEKLWEIIKRTDDRGYSFGKFDRFEHAKNSNYDCITVVIYKDTSVPIGFCALSLPDKGRLPTIDVWVEPCYRDMRFGSALVNKANQESLERFGRLPSGHDKHWTCNHRLRLEQARHKDNYVDGWLVEREMREKQIPLFSSAFLKQYRILYEKKHLAYLTNRFLDRRSLDYELYRSYNLQCKCHS